MNDAQACYFYSLWERLLGLLETQTRRSKGAALAATQSVNIEAFTLLVIMPL
jgi:hypothetical protein